VSAFLADGLPALAIAGLGAALLVLGVRRDREDSRRRRAALERTCDRSRPLPGETWWPS